MAPPFDVLGRPEAVKSPAAVEIAMGLVRIEHNHERRAARRRFRHRRPADRAAGAGSLLRDHRLSQG
jgi:hypothetical protein